MRLKCYDLITAMLFTVVEVFVSLVDKSFKGIAGCIGGYSEGHGVLDLITAKFNDIVFYPGSDTFCNGGGYTSVAGYKEKEFLTAPSADDITVSYAGFQDICRSYESYISTIMSV